MDRFLSVLTSLIGLIPGVGQSPLHHVAKRITLETAKGRWNPSQLPGLESMVPQAPRLVALLNHPDIAAAGDLGVIAGDIEGGNWFKRLGIFMTDTFFYENQDNDLVVNTNSMFHGVPRGTPSHTSSIRDLTSRISAISGMPAHAIYWCSRLRTQGTSGLPNFALSKKPK